MKFFDKLPKVSFESTIGTFTISDFFTYLDVENVTVATSNVNVDDTSTLLEAAYQVYQDVNSMWAFVAANQTINPFDLLAYNASLYTKYNTDKINFVLYENIAGVSGAAYPEGTILVPYAGNTGDTYNMGSTGNFNLYGPLALVQKSSFYDGNMIITTQVGATYDFIVTGSSADTVHVIYPSGDTYYIRQNLYTGNKKTALEAVSKLVNSTDAKTIHRETTPSNTTIDQLLDESPPLGGTLAPYTNIQIVDLHSKNILAYVPNGLGKLQASFVTTKYM